MGLPLLPILPPPSPLDFPLLLTAFPLAFRNAAKAIFTVCSPISVKTFPLPINPSFLSISGLGKGPPQEEENAPLIWPQWPKGKGVGWRSLCIGVCMWEHVRLRACGYPYESVWEQMTVYMGMCACYVCEAHTQIWGDGCVCVQQKSLFAGSIEEPGEGNLLSSQLPEQKTKCRIALGCLLRPL